MTNNDVLRRVRYIFDLDDTMMMKVFALAGHEVSRAEISDWLKKEEDDAYQRCDDRLMTVFLNGFIILKRGKKEDSKPEPLKPLNNNIIFLKLKIALKLQADEVLNIFKGIDFRLSPHELSAFFRRPGHKHYRECKDQILRNFLLGLQHQYRNESP